MKDELEAWARRYPDRLKVVHVIGETPDQPLPAGFQSTERYTAEPGPGGPQLWSPFGCFITPSWVSGGGC